MIGEKTAFWFITAGWIAAGFSGLFTAFLAYQSAASLNPLNFLDAALLLGLAYGIFRKSRICAMLALAYFVINQIARVRLLQGPVDLVALIPGAALFLTLYLMSIVGTFVWHRGVGTRPAGPIPTPAERSR